MDITTLKKKYKDSFHEWWSYPKLEYIETWFQNLDFIIGWWLPVGRVVEIFGENGSGKTTFSMHMADKVIDQWEKVAFVDMERTYPERFDRKGIDVFEPDSWEDAVDRVVEAINSWYKLIILDSVAACVPMAEMETSADQMQIGKHARLMNRMMRMVPWPLRNKWATLLLINQLRTKVWAYGNPNETTGGKWIEYACSLRMEICKMAKWENISNSDGEVELKPAKIKITKTKMVWWNNNEAILYLWPDGRYSELMDTLISCLRYEIIIKKWSFLKYKEVTLWQWMIRSALALKDNTTLRGILKEQLSDFLKIKAVSMWTMFWAKETKDIANKLIKEYNKKREDDLELIK